MVYLELKVSWAQFVSVLCEQPRSPPAPLGVDEGAFLDMSFETH